MICCRVGTNGDFAMVFPYFVERRSSRMIDAAPGSKFAEGESPACAMSCERDREKRDEGHLAAVAWDVFAMMQMASRPSCGGGSSSGSQPCTCQQGMTALQCPR